MSDVKVSIKDLSGKFNLINFINKLNTTKETNISTLTKQFESTIQDLQKIKRKVQHKIDDLEDKEKAAEDTRTNNALALNKSFLDITVEFNSLETRLNQVGNTAVRIGEQLETIDKQRSKAVDAKELIQYFLDFDKGDSKKLTQLRKTDEYKAVIIAKRLNAIAKEISIPGTEVARANIEKYCENLERSLLSLFDEALKKKDRELMKQTASTLFDFNGGNSCLQTYINLSSFFINKNVMGVETELYTTEEEENINESKWVKIPQCDPSLLRLYMEVRETCLKEWETISFVFPNSEYVMQQFVQRIFAQSIQAHLETLLTQARETSQLSFLRILSSSHAETEKLIRDLYQFDEDVIKVTALRPVLSAILDRAFEDLFVPYVEGDRWLSVECKSFEERVEKVFSNFLVFVAHRTKNFNRKGTKSAYSPLNIHIPLPQPSKEASSATSMLNRMMGDNSSQIVKAGDENGIPDVETCIKILKIHVEVIVRCKQLVPMNLLHTRITQLFKLLITYFHHYIEAACIIANEDFLDTTPNSKTQPTPKYYPLIQSTSQILKLLQFHFQSLITPLLTNPAIHREMVVFKNEFIGNVEGRLNELLLKQVDAISDWILYILGKQKKIDYKPKDEASAVSTLPCIQICEFIKKTYQHVSTYLDGENSKIFLSEIGSNLHSHLLDHYKKFIVSASGGMILSKDLSKYQQTIAQLHLPNLTQRFEILRELGLLFVTKPESLKTVLSERKYLSRIELSLIYPYAQMREDWGGMGKFEKEIFNVESGSRNNSIKVDAVGVDD